MISSPAKSGSSAFNKTFSNFWHNKQPPLPIKTESTTNSLSINPWSKVVMAKKMPRNACPNVPTINDGRQGTAGNVFSDSEASFMLSSDDSMSLEDDDDQNNFIFDDIFGLEMMSLVDGTTDDQQSLETTPASRHHANVDGTPPTMMYHNEEENPPTAEDDIEFTDLEVATLGLLKLCEDSGAHHRFFDDLLTLLDWFCGKR
jgi:hypothetical protein